MSGENENLLLLAEKDNPKDPYVAFAYETSFPGFQFLFDTLKAKINKPKSDPLKFLQLQNNYTFTPNSFDNWVNNVRKNIGRTKAFQDLIITGSDDLDEKEINIVATPKPIVPKIRDMINKRGLFPHIQLNNQLHQGEQIKLGAFINNAGHQYVGKLNFPLDGNSSIKARITQQHYREEFLPTKRTELKLKELLLDEQYAKVSLNYSFQMRERSSQTERMQGYSVGMSINSKEENIQARQFITFQKYRFGAKLELFPSNLQFDYKFICQYQNFVNLFPILDRLIIGSNQVRIEYSHMGLSHQLIDGFGWMQMKNNWLFHFDFLLGFNSHQLIQITKFTPTLRLSGLYLPRSNSNFIGDKLKLNLGLGISYKVNEKFVFLCQYNLLQLRGQKDSVMKVSMSFE